MYTVALNPTFQCCNATKIIGEPGDEAMHTVRTIMYMILYNCFYVWNIRCNTVMDCLAILVLMNTVTINITLCCIILIMPVTMVMLQVCEYTIIHSLTLKKCQLFGTPVHLLKLLEVDCHAFSFPCTLLLLALSHSLSLSLSLTHTHTHTHTQHTQHTLPPPSLPLSSSLYN